MYNKLMMVLVIALGAMLSYAVYKNVTIEPKIILVKDYKVGRCIVPSNGTGPFIITRIKKVDADQSLIICVRKYESEYNEAEYACALSTNNNLAMRVEGCVSEYFWTSFIDEYNWEVLEDCPTM